MIASWSKSIWSEKDPYAQQIMVKAGMLSAWTLVPFTPDASVPPRTSLIEGKREAPCGIRRTSQDGHVQTRSSLIRRW
jgi:hypothetical protein